MFRFARQKLLKSLWGKERNYRRTNSLGGSAIFWIHCVVPPTATTPTMSCALAVVDESFQCNGREKNERLFRQLLLCVRASYRRQAFCRPMPSCSPPQRTQLVCCHSSVRRSSSFLPSFLLRFFGPCEEENAFFSNAFVDLERFICLDQRRFRDVSLA